MDDEILMKLKSLFFTFFFVIVTVFNLYGEARGIRYSVDFRGLPNKTILKKVKSVSSLLEQKNATPYSLTALRYRIDTDVETILRILHNNAYYDAQIDYELHQVNLNQAQIIIFAVPGGRYNLEAFNIIGMPSDMGNILTSALRIKSLGIELHKPITAQEILDIRQKILRDVMNDGYPFAKISQPSLTVDKKSQQITVVVEVTPGPHFSFGTTTINGLHKVKRQYVLKKIHWNEGEIFNRGLVQDTQRALETCGLFNGVKINYNENKSSHSKNLPIDIELSEAKQYSLGLGVSYTTHKGFGASGDWQNRNVGGMGNLLSFTANIADKDRNERLMYKIYDFHRRQQNLTWILGEGWDKIKAYRSQTQTINVTIDRRLTRHLNGSAGLNFSRVQTTRSDNNRVFLLQSVPVSLGWSRSNRPFHPTYGESFNYKATPYIDFKQPNLVFLSQQITTTVLRPIVKKHDIVGVLHMTIASVVGASRQAIPPPCRLYAGSEKTLRGYSYLTVCPLDDTTPIGGRSMFIYGVEVRFPIDEDITMGPFFEQGNVYASSWPSFKEKMLKSFGWEVRFATPIGPLSGNIAFPLDRRKGIDKPFQIYLAIGSNF